MLPSDFFTIPEASRYTNKSEMTIRRLVKKIFNDYQVSGQVKLEQLENGSKQYSIQKAILDLHFPQKEVIDTTIQPVVHQPEAAKQPDIQNDYQPINTPTQDQVNVLYNDQIEFLKGELHSVKENLIKKDEQFEKYLTIKDEQMAKKDDQIQQLLVEVREARQQSNVLLKNLQESITPLLEERRFMVPDDTQQTFSVDATNKSVDVKEEVPVEPQDIKVQEKKKKKFWFF